MTHTDYHNYQAILREIPETQHWKKLKFETVIRHLKYGNVTHEILLFLNYTHVPYVHIIFIPFFLSCTQHIYCKHKHCMNKKKFIQLLTNVSNVCHVRCLLNIETEWYISMHKREWNKSKHVRKEEKRESEWECTENVKWVLLACYVLLWN